MLLFLWLHREKPRLFSHPWFKSWAKRLLLLPSLAGWSFRLARLRARGAQIGRGSMIAPANISGTSWLTIGQNSFIGRIHLQAQARVQIGSHVCINDGVRIITASHDVRDPSWQQFAKPIRIEDFAWIATGATILPGVTVGRGAVVGAGAVVAKDIPDFAIAVGNPGVVRQDIRPKSLDYDPVRSLAVFTAWLGTPRRNDVPQAVSQC